MSKQLPGSFLRIFTFSVAGFVVALGSFIVMAFLGGYYKGYLSIAFLLHVFIFVSSGIFVGYPRKKEVLSVESSKEKMLKRIVFIIFFGSVAAYIIVVFWMVSISPTG
jgi:hypothetical protein